MHSDSAAVPPAVPWPAARPSAALASCSVTSPHAVMPLPPGCTATAVAAGVGAEEVAAGFAAGAAAEEVAAGFAPGGAVDVFAAPQLARSRQPTAVSRALLVPVPIMMISIAGRGSRPRAERESRRS